MTQGDNLIRDPEDRIIDDHNEHDVREKYWTKPLLILFLISDPPSSIPNPDEIRVNRRHACHFVALRLFQYVWCCDR